MQGAINVIAHHYISLPHVTWLIGVGFPESIKPSVFEEHECRRRVELSRCWGLVASLAFRRPTRYHKILAELVRARSQPTIVITTSIDGLIAEALGEARVIELYGSVRRLRCTRCGETSSMPQPPPASPPSCRSCKGFMVPDIVLPGEPIPRHRLMEALGTATSSDLVMLLALEHDKAPQSLIPVISWRMGSRIVYVSEEPVEPFSSIASITVRKAPGEFLEELLSLIQLEGKA
ncbi:MAG: Sir2 family NAD-dependent protein deacetylase [Pyrodictiaceae archaeon]